MVLIKLYASIIRLMRTKMNDFPVIMCIGTDAAGGDCLGPIVGEILIARNLPAYVYGTLLSPITALNLETYYSFIKNNHSATIIAVDSCVGKNVGNVYLSDGGLYPGAASGKNLPIVGDVSVTAVTSRFPPTDKRFFSVRLGFIYSLAVKVADLVEKFIANSCRID